MENDANLQALRGAISLVLAVPCIVAIVLAWLERRKPGFTKDQISGFRGWLLLVVIGQCLNPVWTLMTLAGQIDGYKALSSMPGGIVAVAGEVFLDVAVAALQIYVLVAMFRRSASFPKLYRYQWLAMIASQIIDWFWVVALMGIPLTKVAGFAQISGLVIVTFGMGIWVWYVSVSRRVRNTFIR